MKNKYSGYCYVCGEPVEVGEGFAELRNGWVVRCKTICTPNIERKDVARDSAEYDAGAEGGEMQESNSQSNGEHQ